MSSSSLLVLTSTQGIWPNRLPGETKSSSPHPDVARPAPPPSAHANAWPHGWSPRDDLHSPPERSPMLRSRRVGRDRQCRVGASVWVSQRLLGRIAAVARAPEPLFHATRRQAWGPTGWMGCLRPVGTVPCFPGEGPDLPHRAPVALRATARLLLIQALPQPGGAAGASGRQRVGDGPRTACGMPHPGSRWGSGRQWRGARPAPPAACRALGVGSLGIRAPGSRSLGAERLRVAAAGGAAGAPGGGGQSRAPTRPAPPGESLSHAGCRPAPDPDRGIRRAPGGRGPARADGPGAALTARAMACLPRSRTMAYPPGPERRPGGNLCRARLRARAVLLDTRLRARPRTA
jgi:hypothetical protein